MRFAFSHDESSMIGRVVGTGHARGERIRVDELFAIACHVTSLWQETVLGEGSVASSQRNSSRARRHDKTGGVWSLSAIPEGLFHCSGHTEITAASFLCQASVDHFFDLPPPLPIMPEFMPAPWSCFIMF